MVSALVDCDMEINVGSKGGFYVGVASNELQILCVTNLVHHYHPNKEDEPSIKDPYSRNEGVNENEEQNKERDGGKTKEIGEGKVLLLCVRRQLKTMGES
uniref:Uncharacterized protein n=1 Tax=Nelumbo nucifera TaxID=4432 RepID=A0A822YLV1_NELNU|nr:TPA_asm: hypothetical protein HUJ06_011412 [Nelumbo nucifera]